MKTNGYPSRKTKQPAFVVRAQRALGRAARNVQVQNRASKLPLLVWSNEITVNKQIVDAINTKSVLRFVYDGKERVVEPQTHGLSFKGKEVLRAHQIGGGSRSGQAQIAKLFDVEKMSKLKKTGEHFSQALPEHNPNDSAMVKIYATLPAP